MSANRAYSRLGFGSNGHSNGHSNEHNGSNGHNGSCPLNALNLTGSGDSRSELSFTETDSGSKSRPRSRLTINCKQKRTF